MIYDFSKEEKHLMLISNKKDVEVIEEIYKSETFDIEKEERKISKIFSQEGLYPGRMISGSKSAYRNIERKK
jgi:transcription antitermination factor NusA-like protein